VCELKQVVCWACAVTCQNRSTQRKPLVKDPRLELRQRMHEIVRTRGRYGYQRVHILLKRVSTNPPQGFRIIPDATLPGVRTSALGRGGHTPKAQDLDCSGATADCGPRSSDPRACGYWPVDGARLISHSMHGSMLEVLSTE
jgi:hypothetical protein